MCVYVFGNEHLIAVFMEVHLKKIDVYKMSKKGNGLRCDLIKIFVSYLLIATNFSEY